MGELSSDLPMVDYHVHLEGEITLERALALSAERGVRFGLVEHGGRGQALHDDASLLEYIRRLEGQAALIGMQAEGLDWMGCFSTAAVARLDYVLTDALTFPAADGRLVRLWEPDAEVGEVEAFMDRYVDFHLQILETEPIDILANPTFLPAVLAQRYGELWTPARMDRLIEACVEAGVAIEINSRYSVPSSPFIARAREAGATFAFGSNYHSISAGAARRDIPAAGPDGRGPAGQLREAVGQLDYCVEMARQHGLEAGDLFVPRPAGCKPIEVRA